LFFIISIGHYYSRLPQYVVNLIETKELNHLIKKIVLNLILVYYLLNACINMNAVFTSKLARNEWILTYMEKLKITKYYFLIQEIGLPLFI